MSNRPAVQMLKATAAPQTLPARRGWHAALGIAACVVAGAFTLALAVRPTDTVDLGYHLAYGQRFLNTGHIVDDDSFIYPPITPEGVKPEDMPPGSWFDARGHYHFINANWLSQVILALLWPLGGWAAMNAAMIILVAIILAAQAAALLRLRGRAAQPASAGVAQPPSAVQAPAAISLASATWPAWLAAVWLATGVIGHERFMLRPELFSFACLAVQLWLLVGPITWPRIAAFIAVQLLAVNLHSYWLLGVALVGSFWADAALRGAWARWITLTPLDPATRRRLIRLSVCLAAMVPAAMAHPAGPANAVFPLRTLSYLKRFDVSGLTGRQIAAEWQEGRLHPWASIGEFSAPLTGNQWAMRSTQALAALLAAAALAAATLAWRRQWGPLFLLAGLAAVSMSMRRNIVIFPFLAGPVIAAALAHVWLSLRARAGRAPRTRWWARALPVAAPALALALGLWWLAGIATNRFYDSERRLWTLGLGVSQMNIPLGACRWLDEHLPNAQAVFTDQPNSSSVMFFSNKVTGVPVLTNTWAMPADRFDAILRLGDGRLGIEQLDKWGFDVAVIRVWPSTRELVVNLLTSSEPALHRPADRQWALVYAETSFMLFVRRSAATPDMLGHEIVPATFDAAAFADRCRREHPVAALALKDGAVMLQNVDEAFIPFRATQDEAAARTGAPPPTRADWLGASEYLWRACLESPPGDRFPEAWLNLGVCLARHSIRLRVAGDPARALDLLRQARDCFGRALDLKPGFGKARINLRQAEADLLQFGQAVGNEKTN